MSIGAGDRWGPQPQGDPFAPPHSRPDGAHGSPWTAPSPHGHSPTAWSGPPAPPATPGPGLGPAPGYGPPAPPAGPGPGWAAPAYGPPAPPPRRRRGLVVLAVVVGALLTPVGLGVVAAVVIPVVLNAREQPAPCGTETAPPGAPPEAVAYVEAANRTTPGRTVLSDAIVAEGHMVTDAHLAAAVTLDDAFLADLRAIPFSPETQPAGQEMIAAVEAYRAYLVRVLEVPMDPDVRRAEGEAVNARRAQAGDSLRDALGLPPSGCAFHRP